MFNIFKDMIYAINTLIICCIYMIQKYYYTSGVDVTAGPLAGGQYIYGRASQTEQRSARWASWYSRATWASNFRYFRVIQYRLITD
jgi:hypothetical protein